jgi:hypothetical protein
MSAGEKSMSTVKPPKPFNEEYRPVKDPYFVYNQTADRYTNTKGTYEECEKYVEKYNRIHGKSADVLEILPNN